ncbi:hypothetical protein EV2_007538 [Malus domestica]
MLFPCLFLWPCSYLQDKEKVSNQSYKKACGDKRNRTRADTSTTLSTAKSALYYGGNQKTLQPSSRISLWKVTSSKSKLGDLGDFYYMVCIALDQA